MHASNVPMFQQTQYPPNRKVGTNVARLIQENQTRALADGYVAEMDKVAHQAAWAEKQGAYKPASFKEREQKQIQGDVAVAADLLKETRRAGLQKLYAEDFEQWQEELGRMGLAIERVRD